MTSSGRGRAGRGRRRGRAGAGSRALGLGVRDGALADKSTLDDSIGVVLLEGGAVEGLGGLEIESTVDFLEGGERDVGEFTREVNSTADSLEASEAIDDLECGVVGNLESTAELGKHREGDVGEIRVVIEDETLASGGQVGSRESLEGVGVETKGTVDRLERWHLNGADVAESSVQGEDQVGEANLEISVVGREADGASSVGNGIDVNGGQVGVVVDVHVANGLERDTGKRLELSVGDGNLVGLLDASSEVETLKSREGSPSDSGDACQGIELKVGQDGEAVEREGTANGVQRRRAEGGQVGSTVDSQVTGDLSNAVQGERAGNGLIDNNIAGPGVARSEGGSGSGAGDGGGAGARGS